MALDIDGILEVWRAIGVGSDGAMRAAPAVWEAQLTHAEIARRCWDHVVYSRRSARRKKETSPTARVARVGCLVCESLDREIPDTFHSVDGSSRQAARCREHESSGDR
mmetsp:Transcript_144913/g.464424  ORF Transcript_144913/g.464424 Transcript_144913/m.464424 type:complete len:108 (-) Transcript_144913:173-496(-)